MAKQGPSASIERVKLLIDHHFAQRLSTSSLARAANLSRYHFIRRFQAAVFETPHRYLMRRRIEQAKLLLATTEMPVTEICFEVGFESLGSFSYLFRREVGFAPSVYRARCYEQRANPQRFIPNCLARVLHYT